MPNEKFVPPSDAVEVKKSVSFVPPSDAVEREDKPKAVQPPAKKKSLVSRSPWEGIIPSVESSVKTEQQPAVSSSVKKAEIPQAVNVVELNSEIKRAKTADGLYTFPEQENAVYKKQNGQWLVDVNKSGNFQPLTKGDVEARSKNLDERAIPLSTIQGPGYEERITYLAKEKAKEKLPATATEEEFNKEVRKNQLIEKQKRLKDLGYDVDINGDATDKKTIDAFNKYSQYVEFKKDSDAKRGAFMQKVDKSLDLNLMNQTEESAVKMLRDKFGKDGFVFDESGAGDAITVKYSIDGMDYSDPITIDLQTFNSNPEEFNKLKSFIKNKYVSGAEKDVILNQSKEKLGEAEDNDAYERRYYKETIKLLAQNPGRFGEKLIAEDQYNNYMDSQYEDLRGVKNYIDKSQVDLMKDIADFKLNPTKEKEIAINNTINELNVLRNNAKKSIEDLKSMESNYYKALGHWSEAKEKQGNFFGSLAASLASGFTSAEKALVNIAADALIYTMPNAGMSEAEYDRLIDLGYTDQEIKSKASGEIKRTVVKDISEGITNVASLGSTTDEYIKSKDRSFLENVATGLAESIGASFSGGGNKTMQGLAFFAQSYNTMQDQMSGKEFDGMSVWEKSALSAVYGIAIGQLEKLGFDQASNITKNSLVDKIVKNTIAKTIPGLSKNASMPAIEEAIGQNLKKSLMESGIRITAGALSEGGVEGIQSVTEDGFKYLVNEIHDKELFKDVPDLSTKEGWKKSLGAAVEDAAAGAVGGMIMSSYDSFTSKRGDAKSDSRFELMRQSLMNETTLKAVQMKAKMELENGDINQEQYDRKIEGINNTVSTLEKIPDGYTVREKRKAFELINQKQTIERGIEGKDPLLVTKEKKQIADIDAQLVALSEADRVKEEPIDVITDLREDFNAELENRGISPEMVEMNDELNGKSEEKTEIDKVRERINKINAASERGELLEDSEPGELKRLKEKEAELIALDMKTAETSGSDSTVESGENQKEVEKLRADEQAELAEAIPNIDDYKVDGKVDREKIMASEDGAKYNEIYDKYDKLITPLLPKVKEQSTQPKDKVVEQPTVKTEELIFDKKDKERIDKINESLNSFDLNNLSDGDLNKIESLQKERFDIESKYGVNDLELKHGTPHDFSKFELEKIGTGEGAQAFGYGLYFTENDNIAKSYAKKLSEDKKGIIYTVKIKNGKSNNWLEWREPISSEQATALSKVLKTRKDKYNEYLSSVENEKKHTGAAEELFNDNIELDELNPIQNSALYNDLVDAFGQEEASSIMKEAGIDGVKYNTKGGKGNDFNYVIFNHDSIEIVEKKKPTEQPTTLEEVKSLDVSDPTNLKKVQSFLDNAISQLDSFGKETLGMNLPVAVARVVLKTVKKLVDAGVSLEQAFKQAAQTHDVKEVDILDTFEAIQNKQKESEASKSAKDISKKDNTKVTVTERVALKDQLRMEAKAARESAMNIKKKQRALADSIKAMAKAGKITASQSANLLRKLSNLNVDNEDTTQVFLDYADRLFANAEYSDKVDKGFKAKAKIKAKLKSKNQAPVTQVAKEFATIDPSLVTDIDKYNEMADAMLAAIAPSVSGVKKNEEGEYEANNKLKTPINIADVQSYVEKALEAQKEIEKQRLLSYYKELVDAGILNDKMSIEEIREVVANEKNDDDKLTAKERAKIVMDDLKERFAVAKSAIEDILSEKVNIERDEEIDALNDDETYTIINTSTGDVPDFLKDSVSSSVKTTVRKGLFGKKKSFEKTKIVFTGKQIKEKYYSFEKQNENISESDREIIKRLISLDITNMKIKDAMALVDAANNFIENGITAGLRNEVPLQEGNTLMKDLANKGFVAKSIGFLRGLNLTEIKGFGKRVNTLGKAYATQIMSITAMADTLFGQKKGVEFLEKIGFQKLSQGVAKAKTIGNKIINSYVKEFGKTKPNGQRFNTPFNTYERGVYASLARTVFGTDADKKAEFDRKLKELKNSAEKLIQSNEPNLMRKGNMYNEIIEKLGLNGDNVTIDTVIKNADAKNVEAVDWWINEWQQHYSDLYDTSLGVYNVMLNKDENYTPDRFSKIDQSNKEGDLGEDEGGAFATSMNLEKSKSGVLMESKKKPSGENRYLDIDFDSNNKAALDEALIDIYTAEAIRQIRGAVKSEAFKKVIPESDVRKRFEEKIDRYIKIKKGKGEIQDEDARKLERAISLVSKYATGRVLGSMASFPAQSIPPLLNTLINARRLDFRDSFNPDAIQWMIDNGASPSIRGLESLDNIKRVNEKGLRQAGSTFDAILSGAENVSDFWLNQFLVRGDKYAATASWLTYYKQSLKKQKENTDIDWNNHKVNKDAFAYANYMVDKNQNPSDSDATGQIFSSQKPVTRVLRNIFIPFSGFSMNQKVKLHSDTVNFFRKGSTVESLSSLTATTAEIVAFHFIKVSIQLYLYKLAINALMGDEDDEEYQKAKKELIKNAAKQTIQDFTSPAPIFDFLTIKAANAIIDSAVESELTENDEKDIKDAYEKDKESRILKGSKEISYDDFKKDFIKAEIEKSQFYLPQEEMFGGTVATAIKTTQLTMDMYDLAINKKIAFKNPDGTYTYKEASDDAVKAGKWGLIAMLAHQAGALPGDAASMSRIILKRAKPTAVRTNIKEVADNFKKDLGLKELTQYQKDMIKSGTSLDKMIENEYKISSVGGLNTAKKQESFKKILDTFGKGVDVEEVVIQINSGQSAESIIKQMREDILEVKKEKDIDKAVDLLDKKIDRDIMIKEIKNSRK